MDAKDWYKIIINTGGTPGRGAETLQAYTACISCFLESPVACFVVIIYMEN